MKKKLPLLFGLIVVAAIFSCIVSESPDSAKTVLMRPGETQEFKVTTNVESAFVWYLDEAIIEGESTPSLFYAPTISDIGEHELKVEVNDLEITENRVWHIRVIDTDIITWQKMFGGSRGDEAYSIQQTSDDGYIVGGRSHSSDIPDTVDHGGSDCYILKLDTHGEIEWHNIYGGDEHDAAYSVQQTSDGGYIVAGSYGYDQNGYDWNEYYVLKLDAQGEIEWQRTYGEGDAAHSIRQTSDNGYIVAGYARLDGSPHFLVLKLDTQGEIEWQQAHRGNAFLKKCSIQITSDGGYILSGTSFGVLDPDAHSQEDAHIIKMNAQGEIVWEKGFGGEYADGANAIQQTASGGYIAAGSKTIGPRDNNFHQRYNYLIHLDSAGNVTWDRTFGNGPYDEAFSVLQVSDEGFVFAGQRAIKVMSVPMFSCINFPQSRRVCAWWLMHIVLGVHTNIVKVDNNGIVQWQNTYGGNGYGEARIIRQTSDGGFILAGFSESTNIPGVENHGNSDFYILKLDENGEL